MLFPVLLTKFQYTMKRTLTLFAVAAFAMAMMSSCSKKNDQANGAMSLQDSNKAGTKGFYEDVMNAHKMDAIDKYCSADFVDHNPDPGHSGKGIADMKK